MRWVLQPGESTLFGAERGCAEFEQRLLHVDGIAEARSNEAEDEVLYVVSGKGVATIDGERSELTTGSAVWLARGTTLEIDEAESLELLSVLVREPLPANGATHAVVAAEDGEEGDATAGRHFRLLATPDRGCASVTQFVGYIPVVRAPDHFHEYDEVVYVLQGNGAAHIGGETEPLHAGTAIHLPARLVHCLENTGPGEMYVVGVFRPAGSPAEAYYPDGTKAQY